MTICNELNLILGVLLVICVIGWSIDATILKAFYDKERNK